MDSKQNQGEAYSAAGNGTRGIFVKCEGYRFNFSRMYVPTWSSCT